jgi:dTDP-4-amino-4,6-dideoxygalactose transaminase
VRQRHPGPGHRPAGAALRVTGEVITTPFSFVATTHALWWNNIRPVFVDIEPGFCNLDPEKVESAITWKGAVFLGNEYVRMQTSLTVGAQFPPIKIQRVFNYADVQDVTIVLDGYHHPPQPPGMDL